MALVICPQHRTRALAGLGVVALSLAAWQAAGRAQGAGTSTIRPVVFQLDQTSPLGTGAALSPDGTTLVYREKDGRLYSKNIATGQARWLLERTPAGMDVFSKPSFSPDGTRLLLSASGGTYDHPSDIYRIGLDGSGPAKLARSAPFPEGVESAADGHPAYARYFYSAEFSPDGSRILADCYDAVQARDNVAEMAADGSGFRTLAQGRPLAWSTDGQGIYYARGNTVERYDLTSKTSGAIAGLSPNILGKVFGKEWFAVYAGGGLGLVAVEESVAYNNGPRDVPLAQTTP
jgi:Tol biopolymer transport system component